MLAHAPACTVALPPRHACDCGLTAFLDLARGSVVVWKDGHTLGLVTSTERSDAHAAVRILWEGGGATKRYTEADRSKFRPNATVGDVIACVSLIERSDEAVLCVWNKTYQGWTLPGGKKRNTEHERVAQQRELLEETGLGTLQDEEVFAGKTAIKPELERGTATRVVVFRVTAFGHLKSGEPGSPVAWKTRAELRTTSPFANFYCRLFDAVPFKLVVQRIVDDEISMKDKSHEDA